MADQKDLIIQELQAKLRTTSAELSEMRQKQIEKETNKKELNGEGDVKNEIDLVKKSSLSKPEIARYSRQMILPEIGLQGQLKLCNTSVLIVGAGGLGCPVALYLTAAGVGCIGIVDYDQVELNNLHRQILHSEKKIKWSKVHSAKHSLLNLNSTVNIQPYNVQLDSNNALDIITEYDIIVDATDNVPTRYLLNDACVMLKKPLVSGSAIKFDGQLTIYNYHDGPCYRCLHPKPPPPETVGNCSDVGVLGVVPGIIGNLQALEVIKMAAQLPVSFNKKLLLFDALESKFTTINLRGKQQSCVVCGNEPTITQLQDYEQFCNMKATDKSRHLKILENKDRINVQEYNEIMKTKTNHLLIDVRPSVEYEICRLPALVQINIPIEELLRTKYSDKVKNNIMEMLSEISNKSNGVPVFAVCHNGNESQKAVVSLKQIFKESDIIIKDIEGGLTQWSQVIDQEFPEY